MFHCHKHGWSSSVTDAACPCCREEMFLQVWDEPTPSPTDIEKEFVALFNKYYEYIRTTDDAEQRGEYKRDFARQALEQFLSPLQKQLEYYKELAEAAEKVYVWQLSSPDSDEFHKAFDHWQSLKNKQTL
jgi:hypothetical protein